MSRASDSVIVFTYTSDCTFKVHEPSFESIGDSSDVAIVLFLMRTLATRRKSSRRLSCEVDNGVTLMFDVKELDSRSETRACNYRKGVL